MNDAEKKKLADLLAGLYKEWRKSKFLMPPPAYRTKDLLSMLGVAATKRSEIDMSKTIRTNCKRWVKSDYKIEGRVLTLWHPRNLTRRVFHTTKWVVLDGSGKAIKTYDYEISFL